MGSIAEINERLADMERKVPFAVGVAVSAMALLYTAEVKVGELSRYTHGALGWNESTNSPPGQPPALVSGALRGSVIPSPPLVAGAKAVSMVGGTTVYARIQELGGWAGRNHASHLPARPYLKPATERLIASKRLTQAACKGWLTVMDL